MGITKRDLELEAIDKAIASMEDEKDKVREAHKVGLELEKMQATESYQLVIEQTYIRKEIEEITKFLGGDKHLPDDMVKEMNKSLEAIRGFKAAMTFLLEAKDNATANLRKIDEQIAGEMAYRESVLKGEVDLGNQDG